MYMTMSSVINVETRTTEIWLNGAFSKQSSEHHLKKRRSKHAGFMHVSLWYKWSLSTSRTHPIFSFISHVPVLLSCCSMLMFNASVRTAKVFSLSIASSANNSFNSGLMQTVHKTKRSTNLFVGDQLPVQWYSQRSTWSTAVSHRS